MVTNLERLGNYRDFVDTYSNEGRYMPERATGGLLSALTPDIKPIVLAGMSEGQLYIPYSREIYYDALRYINNNWELTNLPITRISAWNYCQLRNYAGETAAGSLVAVGAVVKEVDLAGVTGYMASRVGRELVPPLFYQSVHFVNQARSSNIPHAFDSMWKLLGFIGSPNPDSRRPTAIVKVIEFLAQNRGIFRETDLIEELGIAIHQGQHVLQSLGATGVITYDSPQQERGGMKGRDWSRYLLSEQYQENPDQLREIVDSLYSQIQRSKKYFTNKGHLTRIVDFIATYPQERYSSHLFKAQLSLNSLNISSGILKALYTIGILDQADKDLMGGAKQSKTSGNDLTKMFYDMVIAPTQETAQTLSPVPARFPTIREMESYLENYQEEKPNLGQQGGEDARTLILRILTEQGSLKRSHLRELYNQGERTLSPQGLSNQLKELIQEGKVEVVSKSVYRVVLNLS